MISKLKLVLFSGLLCIFTGAVQSANFPGNYPPGIDHRQTIQVEDGKAVRLEFTEFSVRVCGDLSTCSCDYVIITDGNGEILMDRRCGYSLDELDDLYFKPPIITSTSNTVDIVFRTAANTTTSSGWNIIYTTVTPESPTTTATTTATTTTATTTATTATTTATTPIVAPPSKLFCS